MCSGLESLPTRIWCDFWIIIKVGFEHRQYLDTKRITVIYFNDLLRSNRESRPKNTFSQESAQGPSARQSELFLVCESESKPTLSLGSCEIRRQIVSFFFLMICGFPINNLERKIPLVNNLLRVRAPANQNYFWFINKNQNPLWAWVVVRYKDR